MQAIETRYKGYRFRSRLEARWAVYFDAIGIKWEYEPNGFNLGDGILYLPDFWFPQVRLWGEVKPVEFSTQEQFKAKQLAMQSGHGVIALVGTPSVIAYRVIGDWIDDDGPTRYVVLTLHDRGSLHECCMGINEDDVDEGYFEDVADAVIAARSARFEHGECGA